MVSHNKKYKTLAIFPGSFKPPHIGHYLVVEKLFNDKKIDKIYIVISPKDRDNITAKQSYDIWNYYIKNLLKSDKSTNQSQKIHVIISKIPSPILFSYNLAKSLKKNDKLILVKSSKNVNDKRFEIFDSLKKKGVKIDFITLTSFKNNKDRVLSATNMRKTIAENKFKNFKKFIPKNINSKKIWKIVKK